MTPLPTLESYRTARLQEGFDEVLERAWGPNAVQDTHTHPFSVRALVVAGHMWLTVGQDTQELQPGDEFTLEKGTPHAELYGPEGATYWAARKN